MNQLRPDRRPELTRLSVTAARPLLAIYWTTLAIFTHWPRLNLGTPDPWESGLPTDKLLHFGAFGLLSALLISAKPAGRKASPFFNVLLAFLIATVYAYVDEFSQVWFAGREASWADFFANFSVISIFLIAGTMADVLRWRRRHPLAAARIALGVAVGVLLVTYNMTPSSYRPALPWIQQFNRDFGQYVLFDHLAHFLMAMVVTWLLIVAKPFGVRRPLISAVISIALFAASGQAMERFQMRFGRNYEFADLRAHYWGIAVGMVVVGGGWTLYRLSRHALRFRRAPQREAPSAAHPARFFRHAAVVSGLTLVSRLTGLARDAVLAATFGRSAITSAFLIGFLVPNLFRRLFGEGALSSAFIPSYTEWLERDRHTARRLACFCLGVLLVVLGGATLVGELMLGGLLHARAWQPANALAIELAMWMLPYMPMICLVAVLGALLQVHGRFAPAAAAPILLNLCLIAAMLWAAQDLYSAEGVGPDSINPTMAEAIKVVAGAVLIAGVLQLAWVALPAIDVESIDFHWRAAWRPFRGMMRLFLPMVIGLAIFQFNALLDSLIAMALAPPTPDQTTFQWFGHAIAYPIADKGQVASLQWAQRLYQFPLGVFGIAIATAVFPALSHAAAQGADLGRAHFRVILQRGLRMTVFIGLPASLGLMLVRLPLTRVIFERGEFTLEDSQYVARVLAGYAAAIWAYSMVHVLTRAFYALKDPKTPVRVSLKMAGLNFALNLTLVWFLGATGLAWSTAATAMLQCVILVRVLGRRVPGLLDRALWRAWRNAAMLSAVMAGVLWPFTRLARFDTAGGADLLYRLLLVVVAGAGLYLLGGRWLGMEELGWIRNRKHDA